MKDDFLDYLIATDELDEFLEYEPNCPNCGEKLIELDQEEFKYHCPNCNITYNKELTKFIEE